MKKLGLTALLCLTAIGTNVVAQEDDSYAGYDAIINDLKSSADSLDRPISTEVNWDDVALHGGLSAALSYIRVESPSGSVQAGLLKGFEAHLGMNLFSRRSRAEFVLRNFAPEAISSQLQVNLNEFETRLVFLPIIRDQILLRMGAGLAFRRIDVEIRGNSSAGQVDQTHTATNVLIGLEKKVAQEVSLGPDISYRSPITSTAIEKSSWDASFRLNATF